MSIIDTPRALEQAEAFVLPLDKLVWRPTGKMVGGQEVDARAHLTTEIRIGGVVHHLEAVEVVYSEEDGETLQSNVDGLGDYLDDLGVFTGADGAFQSVEIEGRKYVLFMTPEAD